MRSYRPAVLKTDSKLIEDQWPISGGTDTDCNGGTVGSIVGAAIGYSNIPEVWVNPLNDTVKTAVAGFGQGSISELALRTSRFYEEIESK